jgi:hypothetical protein
MGRNEGVTSAIGGEGSATSIHGLEVIHSFAVLAPPRVLSRMRRSYQNGVGFMPNVVKVCAAQQVTRQSTTRSRALAGMVAAIWSALLLCIFAASAGAVASPGEPPVAGASGLPDARAYEQVTPTFKNGNFYDIISEITFGLASADGDSVVYPMSGPVGEATSGLIEEFVSHRTPAAGWQTAATTPAPKTGIGLLAAPVTMIPSADYKRFLFRSGATFLAEEPREAVKLYLSEDISSEPVWLGRPTIAEPIPALGKVPISKFLVAGQSPDLSTIYFAYGGTLISEDASRAQYVTGRLSDPWTFYEWRSGHLVSGGTLPDGSLNPFGAVPASIAGDNDFERGVQETQANTVDNEVSGDGSRVFFVSPDPAASVLTDVECNSHPPCTTEAPELYLREPSSGGQRASVLVSSSALPGHEGEVAPHGVVSVPDAAGKRGGGTDAYASPDGEHVIFASTDRLTVAAPEDESVKEYDYDVHNGSLTYVPVDGPISAIAEDGSEVLFENSAASPWRLELWREGAGGGTATPIGELPAGELGGLKVNVDAAHITSDGSVVVFRTNATIPGFNNHGGFNQVYRYDVTKDELHCVSCPPEGVVPAGEARMSYNNEETGIKFNGYNADPLTTIETRGISADGSRVFFDTPAALVPFDTNGVRDVYEWENGTVYLVSSGAGNEENIYLDSDTTGENVFFAASTGFVPADTDEAYDVYDARIPRRGDYPSPTAVPCKGSTCQGPPSVPQLLQAPASETFNGEGNVAAKSKAAPKKKPKPKPKHKRKKHKVRARKSTIRRGTARGSARNGRGN